MTRCRRFCRAALGVGLRINCWSGWCGHRQFTRSVVRGLQDVSGNSCDLRTAFPQFPLVAPTAKTSMKQSTGVGYDRSLSPIKPDGACSSVSPSIRKEMTNGNCDASGQPRLLNGVGLPPDRHRAAGHRGSNIREISHASRSSPLISLAEALGRRTRSTAGRSEIAGQACRSRPSSSHPGRARLPPA